MEKATFNHQIELKKFNRKEDLSHRAQLIKEFTEKLNREREGTKWKPLEPRSVAILLGHLNTWDVGIFLGSCKDSKNFSARFWWGLKVKKENK